MTATGERWVVGDGSGLRFPADPDALRDGGARFLTAAFRAYGVLADDNEVVEIIECDEVPGGSTGRKTVLTVDYRTSGPRRELFVKFSRDFDDAERDHGRTQMETEIAFAALSRAPHFPVAVPSPMFGDYHRTSGTGVLITERIPFGHNGIERQYEKCMDYAMDDQLGHYRAVLGAVARVAGTYPAGRMPNGLDAVVDEPSVGARPVLDAERLHRRVERLIDFAETYPGLLPANVRSPEFLSRLHADLPRLLEREPAVWRILREHTDFAALCHWNANVDNAWFWRDADDILQCGLLDWGSVGQMNVAMAIWGCLCSAETRMWDDRFTYLLTHFVDEFHACGGPALDVDVLARHVVLYASVMGMTWLLDVPGHVRSVATGLTADVTRMDPAVRDVESVRCRLQMLTNVLNLWQTHDLGRVLDGIRLLNRTTAASFDSSRTQPRSATRVS